MLTFITYGMTLITYGYGIGFDRKPSFSFPTGGFSQNVLIFGVDMSSFSHIDNNKKTY